MSNNTKSKSIWYWLIIILLLSVIPASVYLFSGKFSYKLGNKKSNNFSSYKVPSLKEQPQDTLTSSNMLPLHNWNYKGVNVLFVPTENLPIIDIDVSFNAGSARDGDKFGLSSLTTALLENGTKNYPNDPDTIAEIFEGSGAEVSSSAGRDGATITLRTLANIKELESVLDLYTDIIANPTFDEDQIKLLKEQTIVAINFNKQVPDRVASSAFVKTLYKDHPYGHDKIGTVDTINTISKQDIENFHKQYFVANNANVTIVGGIHRDKAKDIAAKIIDSLPAGKKATALSEPNPLEGMIVKNIDFPGNQSQIYFGGLATTVNDPDNYAIELGNHILGAPFTSRLFREVRVEKGLSYSVGSNLSPMQQKGMFVAKLQTKTDTTKQSADLLREIITNFEKNGPTEAELADAKKHLKGEMSFWFESNRKILNTVAMLNFYNLPYDYFDNYIANIEKVSIKDIKNVFNKKLNFNKSVEVILSEKS